MLVSSLEQGDAGAGSDAADPTTLRATSTTRKRSRRKRRSSCKCVPIRAQLCVERVPGLVGRQPERVIGFTDGNKTGGWLTIR